EGSAQAAVATPPSRGRRAPVKALGRPGRSEAPPPRLLLSRRTPNPNQAGPTTGPQRSTTPRLRASRKRLRGRLPAPAPLLGAEIVEVGTVGTRRGLERPEAVGEADGPPAEGVLGIDPELAGQGDRRVEQLAHRRLHVAARRRRRRRVAGDGARGGRCPLRLA